MDEIRRRRRPAPAPEAEATAPEAALPAPEPAPPPEPAPAQPAPQVSGRIIVDVHDDQQPAPSPAGEPARTCTYCLTRQPLSALREVADSLQCADQAECAQRAAQSGIYPSREDELAVSARESRQGAMT